ncbi:MAG: PASTA domain-containing protein [Proteobacteria bacterium]|nr:PASTA domain-containing protein [Pseudomonadota bacterium]
MTIVSRLRAPMAVMILGMTGFHGLPALAGPDTRQATFEAWINPASISNTKSQDRVISKGVVELMVSSGDSGCAAGAGHVQWRATIGGVDRRLCGGALSLNNWQHIAGTYDGAQFRLYVNGVQVASMARSGTLATNNANLVVGNAAAISRPFHGTIEEVRIWSRALSAAELQANMNVELPGAQAGLLAYYRFNEGDGQTVGDGSGNGRDAVLGSDATVQATDPSWVQTVTISTTVPEVVGHPRATASSMILGAGLTLGTVNETPSIIVPTASVISQSPSGGTSVPDWLTVNLFVSSGPTTGGGNPRETYLMFDGTDDRVHAGNLAQASRITFEAWINPASISNTKAQNRVISKGAFELMVSTASTGCSAGAGHVQWRARIGGVDRRLCGGAVAEQLAAHRRHL